MKTDENMCNRGNSKRWTEIEFYFVRFVRVWCYKKMIYVVLLSSVQLAKRITIYVYTEETANSNNQIRLYKISNLDAVMCERIVGVEVNMLPYIHSHWNIYYLCAHTLKHRSYLFVHGFRFGAMIKHSTNKPTLKNRLTNNEQWNIALSVNQTWIGCDTFVVVWNENHFNKQNKKYSSKRTTNICTLSHRERTKRHDMFSHKYRQTHTQYGLTVRIFNKMFLFGYCFHLWYVAPQIRWVWFNSLWCIRNRTCGHKTTISLLILFCFICKSSAVSNKL